MIKPLIKLRRILWLPIQNRLLRRKYVNSITLRPVGEVWNRLQEIKKLKVLSMKGMDARETYKYEVQEDLLNWLIDDEPIG